MIVIKDRPPMWDKIDAKFHVAGKPILFAFGDRIYDPMGVGVTKELHAHEEIHGARQLAFSNGEAANPVEEWWHEYIASPAFRLTEELPAHVAEYRAYCKRHYGGAARRNMLDWIASKLASPLYGGLITLPEARHRIVMGV